MNQTEIGIRTMSAAFALIRNSQDAQEELLSDGRYRSQPMQLLREWCTVRVSGPRRSGHTFTVNELVRHFGDAVVVVCPTQPAAMFVKATHKAGISDLDSFRGIDGIRAVIVDCASALKGKQLKEVRKLAVSYMRPSEPFFLILMQ